MLGLGEIIAFLVGGAIPIVAYFGRRWIEKRGPTERMERATKVLDIHERMQRTGLSLDQLRSLEKELSGRTPAQLTADKTKRLRLIEDANMGERSDSSSGMTQLEMNSEAALEFGRANEHLERLLREAVRVLPEQWLSTLNDSQQAWESYRNLQSDLVALQVEGGSMYPMLRYSELERLTLARSAEIKDFIEHIKKIHG